MKGIAIAIGANSDRPAPYDSDKMAPSCKMFEERSSARGTTRDHPDARTETPSLKFRLKCKVDIISNHRERSRTHVLHSIMRISKQDVSFHLQKRDRV